MTTLTQHFATIPEACKVFDQQDPIRAAMDRHPAGGRRVHTPPQHTPPHPATDPLHMVWTIGRRCGLQRVRCDASGAPGRMV